ncbi:DUF3237 domain-containing protein [Bradyrhizobium commune]|nr:DUF3237 domain-containing protein [Bradyrhizobium commune]
MQGESKSDGQTPMIVHTIARGKAEDVRTIMRKLIEEFAFALTLEVPTPVDLGNIPAGGRKVSTIVGGKFEGPTLSGRVIGGSDWLLMRPDGVLQMDARLTLETKEGHAFGMSYTGYRHGPRDVLDRLGRGEAVDPDTYYFRATPVFETSSPALDWINRTIFAATGTRSAEGPTYYIYAIK